MKVALHGNGYITQILGRDWVEDIAKNRAGQDSEYVRL